ncbi:MAG: restriction endonuclease [Desulfobacter sp.]
MKQGKAFELAVHDFVKRLAPNATVIFDHKVKDKDTGSYRQVDVWIETSVENHFPLSILVSCKDYKRKVDISHIGTFINEVRSTGANTGIIYSSSGFTKTAIKKARSNGLSCCRLYKNQPADFPEILFLTHYLVKPAIKIHFVEANGINKTINTWGDLLDLITVENKTVYQELVDDYTHFNKRFENDSPKTTQFGLPKSQRLSLKFECLDGSNLILYLDIIYKYYKGKTEAQIINGSYCINNRSFSGRQSGPVIDMQGSNPGPDWEEVPEPSDLNSSCIAILKGGLPDPKQIEKLKQKPISINT